MRTAHVTANGRKIAVAFVSPLQKTSRETQTRIVKLVKNETSIVSIPPGLEKFEEEDFVEPTSFQILI